MQTKQGGIKGRVAGRETTGSRQRPHTDVSRARYERDAQELWDMIIARATAKAQARQGSEEARHASR
jgi:hypothetical protein